jgi:hypothetical protein
LQDVGIDPEPCKIMTEQVRPSFDHLQATALAELAKEVKDEGLGPAESKQRFQDIVRQAPDRSNPIHFPERLRDACKSLERKDTFELIRQP